MKKILSSIIFLSGIILVSIFLIISITENSNIVSHFYKDKIVRAVQDSTSMSFTFDKIRVKWKGLDPQLIFDDISLSEKSKTGSFLESKSLVVEFNAYESIGKRKMILKEIDFINTNLNIMMNDKKFILNEVDLSKIFENKSRADYIDKTKVRITQSKLNLSYLKNNYSFENISLVMFKKLKNYKLFSTFNYEDNNQLVHLAADFKLDQNNRLTGSFFSQGVNIALNHSFNKNKIKLKSKNLNYKMWLSLESNKIFNIDGLMNFDQLNIFNDNISVATKIDNSSFKFNLFKKNSFNHLKVQNLNMIINGKQYNNNQISLRFNKTNISEIYIKELDFKIAKHITSYSSLRYHKTISKVSKKINTALLSDITLIDFNNQKKLRYFIKFKSLDTNRLHGYKLSNINGKIFGGLNEGYLQIDSKEMLIEDMKKNITNYDFIMGNLIYKRSKGGYKLLTDRINVSNQHAVIFKGFLTDQKFNYNLKISGKLKNLLNSEFFKHSFNNINNEINIDSDYILEYNELSKNNEKYNFGRLKLNSLAFKHKKHNLYGSIKKLSLNFVNGYLISDLSKLNVNNDEFKIRVITEKEKSNKEYHLKAIGKVSIKSLEKMTSSKISNYGEGESLATVTFRYSIIDQIKQLSVSLESNLEGIILTSLKPFKKEAKEQKKFKLNYQLINNQKNYIDVNFENYNMRIHGNNEVTFINVSSPNLQGSIKIPYETTEKDKLVAKLQYFDLNSFQGSVDPSSYPYMSISVNRAKIGDYMFNNFKLNSIRSENGMILENLSFQNKNLSMNASGKWVTISGKQVTFFDGDFSSDDFGKSLKRLGYEDIIKKGEFSSKMVGQWKGSPDLFKLENFDGSINIKMNEGEFLQIKKETKVIGQLLGLFSIASLQKRLSLDFSDFFSRGLSFDEMNGIFNFENSIASVNDLSLKGTFGEMTITGNSNITNKTHNQKLTYIPDLSSMSLISGTLLGGPIGAVASIFYDKLLKEVGIDTNELAAVEYSISGSWQNPEIKLVETFKPVRN